MLKNSTIRAGGDARPRLTSSILLVSMVVTLAGCANQNSIFRANSISRNRPYVITEDAKQRNTYAVPEFDWIDDDKKKGAFVDDWRICAEAAPDVFTALSTSAGADVGLTKSPSSTEAAAKLAIAISEAAGTVERTQTINLLRESMYRTCERYLGGAIGKDAFAVQASRDWRAMVAILAIEQLTRTARPAPTILVPASTNAVITSPTELALVYRKTVGDRKLAENAVSNAENALKEANCPKDPPKGDALQDAKDKWDACSDERGALSDAAIKLGVAQEEEKAMRDAVVSSGGGGTPSAGAKTGGENNSKPGGGEQVRTREDLAAVANTVERIVMAAFHTDEAQLFCLQRLANNKERKKWQEIAASLSKVEVTDQKMVKIGRHLDRAEVDRFSIDGKCMAYIMKPANQFMWPNMPMTTTYDQKNPMATLDEYLVSDPDHVVGRWQSLLEASGILRTNNPDNKQLMEAQTRQQMIDAFLRTGPQWQAIIIGPIRDYGLLN